MQPHRKAIPPAEIPQEQLFVIVRLGLACNLIENDSELDAMDTTEAAGAAAASLRPTTTLPGQVVLVFQGGGALGAYQGGVYQALHEAGIEPNWVIGTSIGAVNGAIIAGNAFDKRLDCIRAVWMRMERKPFWGHAPRALL